MKIDVHEFLQMPLVSMPTANGLPDGSTYLSFAGPKDRRVDVVVPADQAASVQTNATNRLAAGGLSVKDVLELAHGNLPEGWAAKPPADFAAKVRRLFAA